MKAKEKILRLAYRARLVGDVGYYQDRALSVVIENGGDGELLEWAASLEAALLSGGDLPPVDFETRRLRWVSSPWTGWK